MDYEMGSNEFAYVTEPSETIIVFDLSEDETKPETILIKDGNFQEGTDEVPLGTPVCFAERKKEVPNLLQIVNVTDEKEFPFFELSCVPLVNADTASQELMDTIKDLGNAKIASELSNIFLDMITIKGVLKVAVWYKIIPASIPTDEEPNRVGWTIFSSVAIVGFID